MEGEEKESSSFGGDEDVALSDDVPLVDHHQLEQGDERLDDVIKVVAAVVVSVELGRLQQGVAAVQLLGAPTVAIPGVPDQPSEALHPDYGEEVVEEEQDGAVSCNTAGKAIRLL